MVTLRKELLQIKHVTVTINPLLVMVNEGIDHVSQKLLPPPAKDDELVLTTLPSGTPLDKLLKALPYLPKIMELTVSHATCSVSNLEETRYARAQIYYCAHHPW